MTVRLAITFRTNTQKLPNYRSKSVPGAFPYQMEPLIMDDILVYSKTPKNMNGTYDQFYKGTSALRKALKMHPVH